jgi:pyridoxal phosphate enzyme (YggS family)
VAVIKGIGLSAIRAAVDLGLTHLGGNRVQETLSAKKELDRMARWHMIGHLQTNKAGRAAEEFDRVQTIDDLETARALSRHALRAGRTLDVMVQVNASGEPQKHGVAPAELIELVAAVAELPALRLDGIMSIGARVDRASDARPFFAATREHRDRAERATGLRLPELSMGMSGDYEIAIEEGSTMVRIGTALFGERS